MDNLSLYAKPQITADVFYAFYVNMSKNEQKALLKKIFLDIDIESVKDVLSQSDINKQLFMLSTKAMTSFLETETESIF